MSDLTDDDIRRLLELEAKATPGPWRTIDECHVVDSRSQDPDDCAIVAECGGHPFDDPDPDNSRLIAAARNSLRPLAEEVLRLRVENKSLRTALRALVGAINSNPNSLIVDGEVFKALQAARKVCDG